MKRPFTRYRPLRTADRKGGYVETLVDPVLLWGEPRLDNSKLTVQVDSTEDVIEGDVVKFEEA